MVRRPSVAVVHTFELENLWTQSANIDQILCVASLVWRNALSMHLNQVFIKLADKANIN